MGMSYRQSRWSQLLNWVYGPPDAKTSPENDHSGIRLRSLVLDLDTVSEVARILERTLGTTAVYRLQDVAPFTEQTFSEEELAGLSSADRQRLSVQVLRPDLQANGVVTFTKNPGISVNPAEYAEVQDEILVKLMENGRSRVQWRLIARLLAFLPFLSFLATWIWLEKIQSMPVPAHVLGWLVIGGILFASALSYQRLTRNRPAVPAARIRMESRRETASRRADEHTNFKVFIITAPASIAVTLLTAFLTGLLQIPG